jgi:hypothetical protein
LKGCYVGISWVKPVAIKTFLTYKNRTDGWKDNNKKSLTGVDTCLDGKVRNLICCEKVTDFGRN